MGLEIVTDGENENLRAQLYAAQQQTMAERTAAGLVVGAGVMIFAPAVVTAALMAGISAAIFPLMIRDTLAGKAPRDASIRLMRQLHAEVLRRDRRGWENGCWNDPARRARWRDFMASVGSMYKAVSSSPSHKWSGEGAKIMQKNILSLFKALSAWSVEMGKACNTWGA